MKGYDWKSDVDFFDYNSVRKGVELTEEKALNILKDHRENDVIKEAIIYKTPLERWIPKSESVLFHAYLVYRACNKEQKSLCNWWSVEKTGSSFDLQRSKYLYDVSTLKHDKPRVEKSIDMENESKFNNTITMPISSFASASIIGSIFSSFTGFNVKKQSAEYYIWLINKGEPQVNIHDKCKKGASPATVFEVMGEEDGYVYTDKNCKRFAKKIFNEIANCKEWKPIMP